MLTLSILPVLQLSHLAVSSNMITGTSPSAWSSLEQVSMLTFEHALLNQDLATVKHVAAVSPKFRFLILLYGLWYYPVISDQFAV